MIRTHKGAFEYDWRARFQLPLSVVGESMTWGETLRLVGILTADPSSALGASVAGWDHPVARESLVLMDLYDLQHASKASKGKPKPYPRPWPVRSSNRTKPDETVTHEEILAALRRAGHHGPVPERPPV